MSFAPKTPKPTVAPEASTAAPNKAAATQKRTIETIDERWVQRAEILGHHWSQIRFSATPRTSPTPVRPRWPFSIQRFTDPETAADVDVTRLSKDEAHRYYVLYLKAQLPDISPNEVATLKRFVFQLSPEEIAEDLAAIRGGAIPEIGVAPVIVEPEVDPEQEALSEQIRSILNRGSDVSASGEVASTLSPDQHDAYVDALAEAMRKIVAKFHRSAQRTTENPEEDIREYEKILDAALRMTKQALGLGEDAVREPTLIRQRDVPGNANTAMQMLRYLITDSDEGLKIIDPVHAAFGAAKDAVPERACIDLAMSRFEGDGEMVDRLILIDREWAASEYHGEIRIQTAFQRGENLLTKHWKTLPKMVHEALHALTHRDFLYLGENYPTARGRDILTEGVTDLLKNYVLAQWNEAALNEEPILSLVAGLQKTRRTSAQQFTSEDYGSVAEAQEIAGIVTIEDVIAAYIHGQTERIGLPRDSIPPL